jgi:hypothetical protein
MKKNKKEQSKINIFYSPGLKPDVRPLRLARQHIDLIFFAPIKNFAYPSKKPALATYIY